MDGLQCWTHDTVKGSNSKRRFILLTLAIILLFSVYVSWTSYNDVIVFSLKSVYTLNYSYDVQFTSTTKKHVVVSSNTEITKASENSQKDESRSEDTPEMIQEPKWYQVPENIPQNDKWYIAATAAFYDYRVEKVAISIASDASGLIHADKNHVPTFNCVFFFDNLTHTVVVEGHFYTSYIFYCPLVRFKSYKAKQRTIRIPEAVSLVRKDSDSDIVNWTLPVINLQERHLNRYLNDEREDNAKKLAICVGIMYGYQPWLMVLQFIEFHRSQGVQKFFFFYYQIHESIIEIFKWYFVNVPGLIEIIHWDPPHYVCNENYRCQLLRDNYCSYMLMHKYKYVGNCDYDELFYPADIGNKTLLDFLQDIDSDSRGSFTFRAKYHQLLKNDIPEWVNVTSDNAFDAVRTYVPLYHFQNVSTMAGHYYSPKTITKPETVIKRWIHYVNMHVKGTSIYHPTEDEAVLRHFKIRTWWGGWAENADQEVKYQMVDPLAEIGNSTLESVIQRTSDVVRQCKLVSENNRTVSN